LEETCRKTQDEQSFEVFFQSILLFYLLPFSFGYPKKKPCLFSFSKNGERKKDSNTFFEFFPFFLTSSLWIFPFCLKIQKGGRVFPPSFFFA